MTDEYTTEDYERVLDQHAPNWRKMTVRYYYVPKMPGKDIGTDIRWIMPNDDRIPMGLAFARHASKERDAEVNFRTPRKRMEKYFGKKTVYGMRVRAIHDVYRNRAIMDVIKAEA